VLEGLRGSTDASYQVVHALALEGMKFDIGRLRVEETYDLVVVGAGLAGLTAAWSFREKRPMAKILTLDNNDDFGGHANTRASWTTS
jgi:spermidine dehydrogenase